MREWPSLGHRVVSCGFAVHTVGMSQNTHPEKTQNHAPRIAGRPRDAALHQAILDAAYAILVETGLKHFSIEAVATRAGVARTTVYRWWPDKTVLMNESFLRAFQPSVSFTRTDSPRDDFRALLASLAKTLSGPNGRIAASVVAQAQSEPRTQQLFLKNFSQPLRRHSAALLRAGIRQQQFRADLKVARVLDAAVGAVYLRLLFGQSMEPAWARELADTLLAGCY
jgi:AcrR family transcriptional regulator